MYIKLNGFSDGMNMKFLWLVGYVFIIKSVNDKNNLFNLSK